MRLHVHDYGPVDTSGILDGAVLMHRQMSDLLTARPGTVPHDILRGAAGLGAPADDDVVYAGNGPYAYLYHLWRERQGGGHRIVREVHTTFWSGYWTQEELCAPLHRPGDTVLFPSEFTRQVFLRCFPSVRPGDAVVAYPMLDTMPRTAPVAVPARDSVLRIGYLGALSTAKNFEQVLNVFARCHRESNGRATLVFAGKPNDPRWRTPDVLARLAGEGVPADSVTSLGLIGPERLAHFFSQIDVLLFPSTASRESLGRVVFEALAHGVPVIAAGMGPAVELLPERNLVPATPFTGVPFSMDRIGPLGQVDEDELTARLLNRDWEPATMPDTSAFEEPAFFRALEGTPDSTWQPAAYDRTTVERVRVEPRRGVDPATALKGVEQLFGHYFRKDHQPLLAMIAAHEESTGTARPDLRQIVARSQRSLADYRAFPRLVDALVMPPLSYRLSPDHRTAPGSPGTVINALDDKEVSHA